MEQSKTQLIVVEQLPIIKAQLKEYSKGVVKRVKLAASLVCTEETLKEVKKERAELNKEFEELEQARKSVKRAVMSPYEEFEEAYKEYISNIFTQSDRELKEKIDEVENGLKEQISTEVKVYFDEYLQAAGVDFITFENAGVSITRSASMKSLKQSAKDFIDKAKADLEMIEAHEHKDEILIEYKKTLNAAKAVTEVVTRHKRIEEAKARREEAERREAELAARKAEAAKKVDEALANNSDSGQALTPPVSQGLQGLQSPQEQKAQEQSENNDEPVATLSFKVTATIPKLKELKQFLIEGDYIYE